MRIGEAALAAGCQTETIRYYERAGLLPKAGRTDGNYRQYSASDIERLVFIRHARSLDMTLDEIRALLDVRDAPENNCSTVNAVIDEHIDHITERIQVLEVLRRQLQDLRGRCQQAQAAKDCGILHQLGHSEPASAPKPTQRARTRVRNERTARHVALASRASRKSR